MTGTEKLQALLRVCKQKRKGDIHSRRSVAHDLAHEFHLREHHPVLVGLPSVQVNAIQQTFDDMLAALLEVVHRVSCNGKRRNTDKHSRTRGTHEACSRMRLRTSLAVIRWGREDTTQDPPCRTRDGGCFRAQ